MAYRFFRIPVGNTSGFEDELNGFLAAHRVLAVKKRFVDVGHDSFWAICVDYQGSNSAILDPAKSRKDRVDYKELLPPEQFQQFARLRDWRARIAKEEAVPVYTVFNNHQLAAIVQKRSASKTDLLEIEGVGEARVAKYGESILKELRLLQNEAS